MAGNDTATLAINLEGNASDVAKSTASAMEQLRDRITAGQGSIKEMVANLRNLRGSTDEVKAAKDSLKAKLDAERAAISSATLAMLKHGGSAQKTAGETKKLAAATDSATAKSKAVGAALKTAGGPLQALKDKFAALKDVVGEGGAGGAMSLLTLGIAGAVAAVAALVVGVAAAGVSLAKFIVRGADAARSAALLREAAMGGNAQWGKNYGDQVGELAKKVPTAKAEIDKIGKSLAMSHIGGQTWVDTLNAVTQASAALGDEAGGKLKEFVTRGRQFGRFQINPQEMIGSGVSFKEVSEALASSMKIGVKQAQAALFEGRVKLADGAKALRDAVEKKFAGINIRQMLSLENITKKLGEAFDELTAGVDLEPMLKGLKEMASIFDLSTESGKALKQIVEVFGKDLVGAFSSGTPLAKKFVYGLIMGAQDLTIAYLQVRNSLRATFGNSDTLKNVDTLRIALHAGKVAVYAIAAGCALVAVAVAAALAPLALVGAALMFLPLVGEEIGKWFREKDWSALGTAIVDGIVKGLKDGKAMLIGAVKALANATTGVFTDRLQIKSPSKLFEQHGGHIAEGAAIGVENGALRAQSAVDAMISVPSGGGGRGGGGGTRVDVGGITVHVAGGNAQEITSALSSASVLEQITKAIVDAVHGSGVPVPA